MSCHFLIILKVILLHHDVIIYFYDSGIISFFLLFLFQVDLLLLSFQIHWIHWIHWIPCQRTYHMQHPCHSHFQRHFLQQLHRFHSDQHIIRRSFTGILVLLSLHRLIYHIQGLQLLWCEAFLLTQLCKTLCSFFTGSQRYVTDLFIQKLFLKIMKWKKLKTKRNMNQILTFW